MNVVTKVGGGRPVDRPWADRPGDESPDVALARADVRTRRLEPKADGAHGAQPAGRVAVGVGELAAQAPDVGLEAVVVVGPCAAPRRLLQVVLGDDVAVRGDQHRQHPQLGGGEGQPPGALPGLVVVQVDHEIRAGDHLVDAAAPGDGGEDGAHDVGGRRILAEQTVDVLVGGGPAVARDEAEQDDRGGRDGPQTAHQGRGPRVDPVVAVHRRVDHDGGHGAVGGEVDEGVGGERHDGHQVLGRKGPGDVGGPLAVGEGDENGARPA